MKGTSWLAVLTASVGLMAFFYGCGSDPTGGSAGSGSPLSVEREDGPGGASAGDCCGESGQDCDMDGAGMGGGGMDDGGMPDGGMDGDGMHGGGMHDGGMGDGGMHDGGMHDGGMGDGGMHDGGMHNGADMDSCSTEIPDHDHCAGDSSAMGSGNPTPPGDGNGSGHGGHH